MRVAVIDLGTNSTRLLVADALDGRVREVTRRVVITRLGEGVDARRRLLPLPIARVRNCLAGFRQELEAHGAERVLAVATSAVRDAENGEAFLGEVEWSYGFTTRLLTGEEEALLTFRGAVDGRAGSRGTLVVDIGGGSTELVAGSGGAARTHASLDIGCVRLTERLLPSDPPEHDEITRGARMVRTQLAAASRGDLSPDTAVGVGGTITAIAALDQGLTEYVRDRVEGHRLTADAVRRQLDRLAALPLAARRELPALEPERAPVIVAGAVILLETIEHFGLEAIEVSERDLLHGAALEAAALPRPVEGEAPPGAYTCC